jgi:hypothetical protein
MTIVIQTKTQKQQTMLIDAIRVLSWKHYKAVNKQELADSRLPFGGYELFGAEWKQHEIHTYTYDQVVEFVTQKLGYRVGELLNLRSEYYAMKAGKPAYDRDKGNQQVPDTEMSVF